MKSGFRGERLSLNIFRSGLPNSFFLFLFFKIVFKVISQVSMKAFAFGLNKG